jgi:1-acyl-sn-glycerol-3-phosphate acyltransferase
MKQEVSPTNQPNEPAKNAVAPVKSSKPQRNLYEPYITPRILYEMLRWAAIFIIAVSTRLHLRGRHNVPRHGPYIIASNHLSWTDIPLVAMYVPGKVVYMAKEESFTGRLGWLPRFLGAFPVKRGEGDRQSLRTADQQLKKGNVLVIFPEGTRSKSHTLAKGYAGLGMIALRSDVPVIPVAVWGTENVLKKFGADFTISYGEPIILKPKGGKITRDDIDSATNEVMQRIAAMLPAQYRGVYATDNPTPPIQQE